MRRITASITGRTAWDLLYNRKAALDGTFQSRLEQAYRAALEACDRLEQEAAFRGKLKFDRNALEVFVNDRLLAPNTDETWQALRPELEKFFSGFTIERTGEPRDLFRVTVKPEQAEVCATTSVSRMLGLANPSSIHKLVCVRGEWTP